MALAASLLLPGCGGGGGGSAPTAPNNPSTPNTPGTPSAPSGSATIAMRTDDDGYGSRVSAFVPAVVSIARGGTVTWTNGTGVSHNVVFDAVAGAPASVASHTTGSNARTFSTGGTFAFRCTNHAGMDGSVNVAP
jgi:plastocyanin